MLVDVGRSSCGSSLMIEGRGSLTWRGARCRCGVVSDGDLYLSHATASPTATSMYPTQWARALGPATGERRQRARAVRAARAEVLGGGGGTSGRGEPPTSRRGRWAWPPASAGSGVGREEEARAAI
ncbi:hypothetical protein BDA96_03G002000 [Sorghum bicolor]|jgi:hypothetical protein|uniref:Uncharacterized protein n=1 Tax=Sorghum bicolor TaxID=4558 RepID=A0A921R939_SORBI|nr:hypothetical protein BDA96_03G002000 [Sorghum bicolor]